MQIRETVAARVQAEEVRRCTEHLQDTSTPKGRRFCFYNEKWISDQAVC